MKRSTFIRGLSSIPLIGPVGAWAQIFPAKPVTIVVPYATGGPTDTAARIVAEALTTRTGKPFLVQNKPGAATIIGTEMVKAAAADGYTWLLGTTSTFTLNPVLYKQLKYSQKDFENMGGIAKVPYAVVLSPQVPASNMGEFAAWARAKPQPYTYGTVGQGTAPHILGISLSQAIGAQALAVHYKGSSPVQMDLIGGNIDVSVDPLNTCLPMHKAGKVRIVAVLDDVRWPSLPEVPTLREQGVRGVQGSSWIGFFVPAGTDKSIVESMGQLLTAITASTDVQEKFRGLGLSSLSMPQREFGRYMSQDSVWWQQLIKTHHIQLESSS